MKVKNRVKRDLSFKKIESKGALPAQEKIGMAYRFKNPREK
jgi:hypothetical protein